jgi:hypothetical protein
VHLGTQGTAKGTGLHSWNTDLTSQLAVALIAIWACVIYFSLFFLKKVFLFVWGSTGAWTRGLTFARQALYHLSHSTSDILLKTPASRLATWIHEYRHSSCWEDKMWSQQLTVNWVFRTSALQGAVLDDKSWSRARHTADAQQIQLSVTGKLLILASTWASRTLHSTPARHWSWLCSDTEQ